MQTKAETAPTTQVHWWTEVPARHPIHKTYTPQVKVPQSLAATKKLNEARVYEWKRENRNTEKETHSKNRWQTKALFQCLTNFHSVIQIRMKRHKEVQFTEATAGAESQAMHAANTKLRLGNQTKDEPIHPRGGCRNLKQERQQRNSEVESLCLLRHLFRFPDHAILEVGNNNPSHQILPWCLVVPVDILSFSSHIYSLDGCQNRSQIKDSPSVCCVTLVFLLFLKNDQTHWGESRYLLPLPSRKVPEPFLSFVHCVTVLCRQCERRASHCRRGEGNRRSTAGSCQWCNR